ncbi:MAG TPA: Flp pilus assembly protein CpaB [Devosia sp.]|jgi:pilus assembly protein CpaB|nr:Flp pilus assembly protein CpaB [Devosia sp.]
MRVSRIVLLLVALIAGGLAAFLATRGGGEPGQPPVTQVVQEARAQVLIAKNNIGVGERLSAENVQWQDWPEGAVRAEYITSAGTPNAIDQMKGSVARFELFPGEPIQQNKLVRSDQGYLSAVLDKGMRGVSISVAAESASGGFIVPNDHVDVILTQGGPNGQQTSSTLLSNVRVLAINARLGETGKTGGSEDSSDPNASPKSQVFPGTAIATLELDPPQAETIINASQLGRLSLALRSIVDFAPSPGDQDPIKHNAPIKLIRYGQEASVMAGSPAGGGVDATQAGLPIPTTTVTVGPGAALD